MSRGIAQFEVENPQPVVEVKATDYPALKSSVIKRDDLRQHLATARTEDAVDYMIRSKENAFKARTDDKLYGRLLEKEKDLLEKAKERAIKLAASYSSLPSQSISAITTEYMMGQKALIDAQLREEFGASRSDMLNTANPIATLVDVVGGVARRRAPARRAPARRRAAPKRRSKRK